MGPFVPQRYRISLEPDLARLTFRGRVVLSGRLEQPGDEVRLNAADLAFRSCGLSASGGLAPCGITEAPAAQEIAIRLPSRAEGALELVIEYDGILNDRMAGFYSSGYKVGGDLRHVAVTQFEENDARRAFPCVDHPSAKAVFDVEMIVDDGLVALSNMPVEAEEPAGAGRRRVRFAATPPMCTYLVFFGVGAFESLASAEDPRVRVLTVPGRIAHARYAAAVGAAALAACERAFRTPYPLPKLDLIAVPDFAFGAMENWGAITFRENLLLHTPGITSRSEEQRICEVVAHEIAHQWFGDLVSPRDWKYLWLNESFATLYGYRVVDGLHPDWRVMGQFLGGSTAGALSRDGMRDTPAIEIAGDAPVVINASNAPVLYSKGAAVLRQVQDSVGDEGFARGLARFLADHRYGIAGSREVWAALDAEVGKPLSRMMESWISQPGHPIVTAEISKSSLRLRQQRFTYLRGEGARLWAVPVRVALLDADGGRRVVEALLERETLSIDLDSEPFAFKLNAGQTGFYRTRYAQAENLGRLERLVAEGRLDAQDRWGLQNDLFALVRAGEIRVERYLAHIRAFAGEVDYLPASSIAAHLLQAWQILGPESQAGEDVAAAGRLFLDGVLRETGTEPRDGEPVPLSLLRARALVPAALLGVQAALDAGSRRLDDLARTGAVPPDIRQSVLQIAAWTGGRAALDGLLSLYRTTDNEQERLNVLHALGWLPGRELLEEALDFALAEVPSRNRYMPIASAAGNPRSAPWMWDWWKAHLPQLEQLHRMHQERVIASVVPSVDARRAEEAAKGLGDYIGGRPDLREAATLSLELLEINQNMRARPAAGAA